MFNLGFTFGLIVFSQTMLDRTIAPAIQDAIDFTYTLPPCNKTVFENNVPVYWLHAGSQEVVQIEWVFKAGLWNETKAAVAQAVASLLKNGTTTRSAFQINEAIEFYGASLKVSANNDYGFVTLHTLTKHLPQLLPVIQEIIMQPAFPEEELQVFVQNALQRLSVNLLQSDFVANRNIDAMLFGRQHPYGRFTEAEDLMALNTDDLRLHHQRTFRSDDCIIFMAGKISEADVKLLQQYFGKEKWNTATDSEDIKHEISPSNEKVKRMVNDEKSVQGAVRIARDFVTRNHPDFAPMVVLNTVLGGYFGSRLMNNIREEKGFTYGVYSCFYPTKHAGGLLISTEAGKEVCEETAKEVFKEMKILQENLIPEEELLLVKNYLLGNLLGDLDGPFSIIQRWKNLVLNNLPASHFDDNIQIYKTVDTATLQMLAQQYFDADKFYNLVVI